MPRRHFLLIVIVIAIMLIYKDLSVFNRNVLKMWTRITLNTDTFFAGKEFFKRQKMSKMRLIGFVKLKYFVYFQRLFDVMTRWRILLWWLKTYKRILMDGEILTTIYPKKVIFSANFWKLIAIRDSRRLNSKPEDTLDKDLKTQRDVCF